MRWWVLAIVAVGVGLALLFAFAGSPEEGGPVATALADLLATITGRGPRRGPRTTPDGLGVIREDPRSLADSAAVDLDGYALARALASEEGQSPAPYKVAVAWAIRNESGGRVADKVLAGHGDSQGFFARQNARYLTGAVLADGSPETAHAGKYVSTALDPHEDDVAIATAVLLGELVDPTSGATNFFNPGLQDDLYETGRSDKPADAIDSAWRARGLTPVAVEGIDDSKLRFYRHG